MPAEVEPGGPTVMLIAMMLFLTPAAGVPYDELLQDTFKSMLVSFMALAAALLFFWQQRKRQQPLRWHALMWCPLSLMLYALGSMVWSHTYLAGVEAIRWFIVSLLVWLGLNTFSRERVGWLALGIHSGAVLASVWTALQFWLDFRFFPQGPNPASTFINRNFFAEMAICALPFSVYLLAQAQKTRQIVLMAFTTAFVLVALMMTGTRSALTTLWVMLFLVHPLIGFLFHHQFSFSRWGRKDRTLALSVLLGTVLVMGLIPTGNSLIASEQLGLTALERSVSRTASVVHELSDKDQISTGSLSVRKVMWKATLRMIADRPLSGVGAGAWEVDAPLYQVQGSSTETDYYAHNEVLQLLAEYGLAGWIVLIGLTSYLALCAWRALQDRRSTAATAESGMRALILASLLSLFLVSNAGFPLRLASTVAIFAAALGMLAAGDARLAERKSAWHSLVRWLAWRPEVSGMAALACAACLILTAYISQQAAAAEYRLIKAGKIALRISRSGQPNDPQWNAGKRDLLALADEGISINPHYRKITPMVADELARWGDWKNATWIWESVIGSRPYIVAILSNLASAYAQMGDNAKALEFIERGKKIQPDAANVRAMEVVLLTRLSREQEAAALARQYLRDGIYDYNLANAAISLGLRKQDYELAIEGLEARNKIAPAGRVEVLLELGGIYAGPRKDEDKALASYRAAMAATSSADRERTREKIPASYRARL